MKIFLCRYKENAAVIAASDVTDARTAVIDGMGAGWNPGVDDRKKIQCRAVRGVTLTPEAGSFTGTPIVLQTSKS